MKIAVASVGRTHMLNTAIGLLKAGGEVCFYTTVPSWRCETYGLPSSKVKSVFFPLLPFILISKFLSIFKINLMPLVDTLFDIVVSFILRSCDVYITGSLTLRGARKAKQRYGAAVIRDVGMWHIRTWGELFSEKLIRKEENLYAMADRIVLPSEQCKKNFEEQGIEPFRLFVNPYGVNLKVFSPTRLLKDPPPFDVIMVGRWMNRKGCDLLAEACLNILKIKLLHVGPIGDLPLPNSALFRHIDPVEEKLLPDYYSQAKVFALPSRKEGFGLVIPQAVACGLPIVFSQYTGGRDIANMFHNLNGYFLEIEELSAVSLATSLAQALKEASRQPEGYRDYLGNERERLSWQANGKRYYNMLTHLLH